MFASGEGNMEQSSQKGFFEQKLPSRLILWSFPLLTLPLAAGLTLTSDHRFLFVYYDNEAYMNTGVQRSSATPPAARTATTMAVGAHPGNVFGTGKNVPLIAMAHRIPYVATASVANLRDLEAKVTRAMGITGARYVHIHVPCPLGWGSAPENTIKVARLAVESGLFPLFEAEHGKIVSRHALRKPVPVDEYLKLQRRFAHLFGKKPDVETLAAIQRMADANIEEFGLAA